jgi:hypothetical protein
MAETPVAIATQPVVALEKLLVVISFFPYLVDDNLFAKPPNGLRYWQVAGVEPAWGQYKLEAGNMLVNSDESHLSSARGVGRFILPDSSPEKKYCCQLD